MKSQQALPQAGRNSARPMLARALIVALAALVLQGCATSGARSSRFDVQPRQESMIMDWAKRTNQDSQLRIPIVEYVF